MRWIDRIPKWLLVAVAVYLAVAPFVPEPHLTEKWRMLLDGTLSKPIDIFDFFLHSTPLVVLAIRLVRDAQRRRQGLCGGKDLLGSQGLQVARGGL